MYGYVYVYHPKCRVCVVHCDVSCNIQVCAGEFSSETRGKVAAGGACPMVVVCAGVFSESGGSARGCLTILMMARHSEMPAGIFSDRVRWGTRHVLVVSAIAPLHLPVSVLLTGGSALLVGAVQ